MREAMRYERIGHRAVQCHLCPRNCVIQEGRAGSCGVRKNRNGTLYALTYGRVVSLAVDPIEKKPLYHFYPGSPVLSVGTFGCNLRCKHCQNWQLSHHSAAESGEGMQELSPEELVETVKRHGCPSLAWTYNEPSVWYEYVLESARLAQSEGIHTVLVTSGMINAPALRQLLPYVDAYRLDVKGFSEELYERLTGSRVLATVLGNGLLARQSGAHVEIVTNIIPSWNDGDDELDGLSRWIAERLGADTPWHVTAYHPSYRVTEPPTPRATLERARRIGLGNGLRYVYIGNLAGHTGQRTQCPGCGRTLIERTGFGTESNYIVQGHCSFCGCEIAGYRDADVPVRRRATPFP